MKSSKKSTQRVLMITTAIMTLIAMALPAQIYAAMGDYCIMPPYVKRDVKPNILILMDNALDMSGWAYSLSSDPTYSSAKKYYGYFKPGLMYYYSSNRWVPASTRPISCTGPSCVYMSGNLLNWATASKYDVLQNILLGGISTSRQTNVNTLISKSNFWHKTLTYPDGSGNSRTCIFNVNNGNVEVTEPTPGACGYLDNPANPIPGDPAVASIGSDERFAENPDQQQENYWAENSARNPAPETPGFWSKVLSAIVDFLVPSAEASNFHISGGSSALPLGTECTPYSVSISASGGTGNGYTWSWVATSPSTTTPPGLTLISNTPSATISGTPTNAGTYYFTVTVNDSGGNTDSKGYSITISSAGLQITTSPPLSDGILGNSYSTDIAANGVCAPYTWSITAGSLPPGLTLGASGTPSTTIFGTPGGLGTYTFTVQVAGPGGQPVATKQFDLYIDVSGFSIVTSSPLPSATKNVPYSTTLKGIGGTVPYVSWTMISGSMPPGINFSTVAADKTWITIAGTPTSAGTYTFTVRLQDNGSRTTDKTFALTVYESIRTTRNLNVQVCTGNYTYNCNNANSLVWDDSQKCWSASGTCVTNSGCSDSDHTTCILKSGLVDQYWSQARFGVMDFNKGSHGSDGDYAYPNMENCIEINPGSQPDSNFMTAIENAVGIDPPTTLVNGEYEAVNYYKTNETNNCDPYAVPAGEQFKPCRKSFSLILTSGIGADNPQIPTSFLTPEVFSAETPTACPSSTLSNLAKNSCYGYNVGDLRPPSGNSDPYPGRQYVTTYIVNTMGTPTTGTSYDPSTLPAAGQTGNILYQAAKYGGGLYYEVQDPAKLKADLEQALQDIIKRAAAGTAASVLASGEGSGANLVQAVFYPRKQFGNDEVAWIGRLSNLWYYVDPRFSTSNIREDDGDRVLTLLTAPTGTHQDYITQLYFDTSTETTKAHRWEDPDGNGSIGNELSDIDFESLGNLWEAGKLLWNRSAASRTIYTSLTGNSLISFVTGSASDLRSYLTASTDSESEAIIRWVRGEDTPLSLDIPGFTPDPDYRHRSVSINGVGPHTWKLGDVLNSTPKVSTWMPLSGYHKFYNDGTYGVPGQDPSLQEAASTLHYVTTARYKGRGMIFAGANDGMLHAFRLGTLQLKWTGQGTYDKAMLSNNVCSGDSSIECVSDAQCDAASPGSTCLTNAVTLGEEVWAYIPKNVLPYLKYTADAGYGNCHLYSVDLTPYIFDASIGDASDTPDTPRTPGMWRTILIGGMRYGGACTNYGAACAGGGTDCVKTPVDGLGYSAYFALDITYQNNPVLLWEKSAADLPGLGFTTAGPAVVRINSLSGSPAAPDKSKNGHWFVALASGPTGSIDTGSKQFLGTSDQELKIFVLNLKDGSLAGTITTGIYNAFAGSMYNATLDTDLDYQDDVIYVPYVKLSGSTWTDGGVGRISTHGSSDLSSVPWTWSTVMDGIGPVTSAVTKLQNNSTHTLWVFFGTGRYYYELGNTTDDGAGQRKIFGVKDPCFYGTQGFHVDCTSSAGVITDVTSTANIPANPDASDFYGWSINLDADGVPDASLRAERVITDPLATTQGIVFFTTYKPYSDECALGGKSFIWAVKYNNGGDAGSLLQGKALVQVSTGSIEQLNLSSAFTDKGGRRSGGMEGVPPTAQGLSILSTPAPVKRVLHIRER